MGKLMLYVGILLGVIIIIATFLPWATVSMFGDTMVVRGTEGDGFITLAAAVLYIIALFLAGKKMIWKIIGAVFSLVSVIVAIIDLNQLKKIPGGMGELGTVVENMVQIGIGLWLVLIAGILGVIVIFLVKKEETPQPTQTTT